MSESGAVSESAGVRGLLLSNSTNPGAEPLAHARDALAGLLTGVATLVFVPYALADHDGYTARTREALSGIVEVTGAHTVAGDGLATAEAVYVGGGNTFRLLAALQRSGSLARLRERVIGGMPYVGASAGSCIAGPSIRTTNDMPIVAPRSFSSLGLLPWHLNCHYRDPPAGPRTFMGETRDERLAEFLEENEGPVVCLREGAWLELEGGSARLGGAHGGRRLLRGGAAEELATGARLDLG